MREPVDWPTRDLAAHRVESTPERIALSTPETALTYRDLDARVDEAVAVCDHYGATDGGVVAALTRPRWEVAAVLFGAMRSGGVFAPLHVDRDDASLRAQLRAVDPAVLVCEAATESRASELAPCPVVSLDESEHGGVRSVESLREVPFASERAPVRRTREDPLVVLFTSGTTSEPKGVRLTVGNLVASATASAFRLGVDPADRWLVCLPTAHMGGLAPFVRSALYGTGVVVQRAFDPDRTAETIADESVTGVSLVPTMLRRLLDAGWTPPPGLRFVLLGGGPASESLVDRCAERGVPVYPSYGMTETSSQIATAAPSQAFEHPGTVGQPLLFTEVSVVVDGEVVGPEERGELVVDGPTVAPGYLDADQTAAAFGRHGFHTGDLGYRDADGRLWVTGRIDDQIVTGGENVLASEVAAGLESHPEVSAAAVVGVPDEEWGERVVAMVVGGATPAALRAYAEERLAAYERPKEIAVVESLPRTASGTVDRDAVRSHFRQ